MKGYIFDLDGVLVETRDLHYRSWEKAFKDFFHENYDLTKNDYSQYFDGRTRKEGIEFYLHSLDIYFNDKDVKKISQVKNKEYQRLLAGEGVHIYYDALIFLHSLKKRKISLALISSSKNTELILRRSELKNDFPIVLHPALKNCYKLRGKPEVDYLEKAFKLMSLQPFECAFVEDSYAGVEAGLKAGIGRMIFVKRESLKSDIFMSKVRVVSNLLDLEEVKSHSSLLPYGIENYQEIFISKKIFLFLDFDGTLSEIVDDPDDAVLFPGIYEILQKMSQKINLCIISGREVEIIKKKCPLKKIFISSTHGLVFHDKENKEHLLFEIQHDQHEILEKAFFLFQERFRNVKGFILEKKKYGLAIHYRKIKNAQEINEIIKEVRAFVLQKKKYVKLLEGEMVLEILPQCQMDKGKAIKKIYQILKIDPQKIPPLYIGDGQTDEYAFREVQKYGFSFLCSADQRPTLAQYYLKGPKEVKIFLEKLNSFLNQDS